MDESGQDEVRFEELRSQGETAALAGRLAEAKDLLDAAYASARRSGCPKLIDLALCNLVTVKLELGEVREEIPTLREVLMRNGDPAACCLAARGMSRFYELAKNYKKSLFYARIMHDRAKLVGRRDWLSSSHNMLGNAFLGESFVDEAAGEYRTALELLPPGPSLRRAAALDNLGYCRVLQDRFAEAFRLLYQSLRMMRKFKAESLSIVPHLDLAFLHLETGRYRDARRHGLAALHLAEEHGQSDSTKNALYLLGEISTLAGDASTASGFFSRLQNQFFPGASYLPSLLAAVDVRGLINLHA